MLFIVWCSEAFADSEDRVGVVEAPNIEEATETIKKWASADIGDYEELSRPETTIGTGYAEVAFHRRVTDSDETGWDRYQIRPRENPFMFLVEDWKLIFS